MPSKVSEHFPMAPDCPYESGLYIIGISFCMIRAPPYGRNFTVMYMAYVGEKVVFDLVVQSTDIPGKKRAFGRKISRCDHLMYGPVIL